ncbi:helix-turn-helix domain-containing protein [Kitasatospora sp. NPDC006697]|uniref:helix-turn-helix domain-containing protein n=1 Tax=Kitasatospora sp. NPDC006697 TaxID=3364020 RepID=UPI003676A1BA
MADDLGALLREFRKQAGLTQEKLAEESELGVRTIRRLESGKAGDHRLATVSRLADALRATPEQRRRLMAALAGEERTAADQGPHAPTPRPSAAEGLVDPAPEEPGLPPRWPAPPPVPAALTDAVTELAREVRRRWRREEAQRSVHDPFPLPVRWQRAAAELTDREENIQRLPPGASARLLVLSGELSRVTETYRQVTSGRLVVLGRGGSGKSILTIRFILDYLDQAPSPGRVPVIFSLGAWDPTAGELRDWLVDRLLRDHPHLARKSPGGSTLAAALVDADLILPVLDGFDEIAAGLREDALRALNETELPLVLTSRRDEFADAVRAARAPLVWAAGIELADLTVDDLANYLPRTARTVPSGDGRSPEPGAKWEAVLAALRVQRTPASAHLAEVLSTPLMVNLARTLYSDDPAQDPTELLDGARFPSTTSLEQHLLAGFVPAVYRRRIRRPDGDRPGTRDQHWDPQKAQRWLGHLARHMELSDRDRQDLAWWRLGDSLRYSSRILAVVLATALCVTLADVVLSPFLPPSSLGDLLLTGGLVGLVAGLAFGGVYAVTIVYRGDAVFEPSRVRLRLPGFRGTVDRPVRTAVFRFVDGLLGGFTLGIGFSCAVALERALYYGVPFNSHGMIDGTLIDMLLFGLIFGLAGGLVFGLATLLEAPVDITTAATPTSLLASNRATVSRQVLMLAPMLTLAIALGGRLLIWMFQGALGPLYWGLPGGLFIGAVSGLGGAVSYALAFTAWGQWVLLSRIWLPLTGQLPWDTVAFLDDAYQRGVLRQSGAVYQFRHIRLQHHLADYSPTGTAATDQRERCQPAA